ncbi:MAG: putative quinol monooxygenase [Xenococcus sp. MO_188.B8]|nr:putative quinol monooxygenase [Xenococcus sp. MO_188.B8]
MKFSLKIFYPTLVLITLIGVAAPKINSPRDLTLKPAHAQQNKQAEQPLVVIAYLQVKPEYRQTFLDLANNVVKQTNETEKGANSYTFYESQDTPNLFFFFEDWQNEAAFEEHLQKSYTKSLTGKYSEILEESADVRIYKIDGIEQKKVP